MKKLLLALICIMVNAVAFAQLNMTLRSHKTYPQDLSNIGGIAVNGREFALVGWWNGLSIVDVTNPDSVFQVINVPGAASEWREVKTFNNYAYVTTEANGDGLIIVNLNYLPDSAPYKHYYGNGAINNQIQTIHALHIDGGFVYLFGSNLFNGTAVICNLVPDPWNPNYVGNTQSADGNYIHDGYVRNDTLYGCHVYDGYFSIMNVANKTNITEINIQHTPDNFTHNSWLNDAGTVLFTTDEVNNSYLASYDISDPNNIQFLDKFQTDPGSQSIVHNTHTLNDYEVVSWYKEGVVVVDVAHPDNMIEVGHYDTSPLTGGGFDGAWGVYPYLPSGNLLVSDMSEGLFVLTPNYIRGCYLEGSVIDSVTANPLNNVSVQIVSTPTSKTTNLAGIYKTGLAAAGTYDVQFIKAGYYPKTITGVQLTNGVLTTLDVELVPLVAVSITGNVTSSVTGLPIANAQVQLTGVNGNFNLITDVLGNFNVSSFFPGSYNINCGKWGFVTYCNTGTNVDGTSPVLIQLTPGIYDDFTFDFGWTATGTASTGDWQRGEPIGTFNGSDAANPDFDVTNDCSDQAFVTGNSGGGAGNDDVDNGYVLLTSPAFDLTGYVNPVLHYYRWFYNTQGPGGGNPNDSLNISISNGTSTVLIDNVGFNSPGISTWVFVSKNLNSYITSTTNMHLMVRAEDIPSGNVMEGGFDRFEIVEGPLAIDDLGIGNYNMSVYPNPFDNNATVYYHAIASNGLTIVLNDVTGRVINSYPVSENTGNVKIADKLNAGIYFIELKDATRTYQTIKIVKTK
ncbi:MAG: choice-of-anchor B family protein [Bacteroidia bacterium]